ncbi:MAG: 3-dehydroquinate synthase [Phaeodactylibacter sp.]|nr:3-dehydroquinate synthase [Phaeodactylibacter sp.]MCB9277182.1 3-dehydroquinate synthase [Lewinellaceae bacterium]
MEIIPLKHYNIYVGPLESWLQGLLESLAYSHLFVLVDEHTERYCLPRLHPALGGAGYSLLRIPSGELHKNLDSCRLIWQQLMEQEAGRDALLINLGGGVIGDMGGFCAATFKRGIRFIQVPTTLLAQVDASIGGKLGIDFLQLKNSIGLFQDPLAVFIDPAFLSTLPAQEIRSGYAEIIKHSLIADAGQWDQLRRADSLEQARWAGLITSSLLVKKHIVEQDPLEKGIRKALNFGHTIGHAVESLALAGQPLLHGEAVAVGLCCEAYLSHRLLGLPLSDVEQVCRYIIRLYGHRPLQTGSYPALLGLMRNDKKNVSGRINFSLVNPLGKVAVNQYCSEALIEESLDYYNRLAAEGQ